MGRQIRFHIVQEDANELINLIYSKGGIIINENENVVWPVKGLASIKKIDLRHVSNEKGLPDMRIKKCRGSP